LSALARFLYRRSWLITGQSREIVDEVRLIVPEHRVYHFSNGVDTNKFSPEKKDTDIRHRYLGNDEIGVVYAGLHGFFQGLDQILNAAGRSQNEHVRFMFFGDGPEKERLIRLADTRNLNNVSFYPPLPHVEVPRVLASMDIAVVTLKARITGAVPSKIYEAMASGLPIVLAASGEPAIMVEDSGAGIVVAPDDTEGLSNAVEKLVNSVPLRKTLGESGRKAALERFDRRSIVRRFVRILTEEKDEK
jgi:glycosyltransferase involved in cell wall biosynthesis